jgi:hypothetical protein
MKITSSSFLMLDVESTASREALRLIVEVFRDGHRAATDLRDTAEGLTPIQLARELEAIERGMLHEIARICDTYDAHSAQAPRN